MGKLVALFVGLLAVVAVIAIIAVLHANKGKRGDVRSSASLTVDRQRRINDIVCDKSKNVTNDLMVELFRCRVKAEELVGDVGHCELSDCQIV